MGNETGQYSGQIIDNTYKINELLGRGGMGEAYKADLLLHQNTPVVVKFLTSSSNPKAIASFEKEAETHRLLEHQNIIRFYRYAVYGGDNNRVPYIVMEFAAEGSLQDLLQRTNGLIPIDRSVDLLLQVSEGLGYAHTKRVLHRDIKPANILLGRERVSRRLIAMLSDFGITKTAHMLNSLPGDLTTDLQLFGLGTFLYMSPEQFMGEERIPSDIYSLGIVAYQLFTGQLPLKSQPLALRNVPVPAFNQTSVKMTSSLESVEVVVVKALDRDPRGRHQSAREFGDNLEEAYTRAKESELQDKRIIDMQSQKEAYFEQLRSEGEKLFNLPASDRKEEKRIERGERLIQELEYAERLFPKDERSHIIKGDILVLLGRSEDALAAYDMAMQINPKSSEANCHKGQALYALHKDFEALDMYGKAIEVNPNDFRAYYLMANQFLIYDDYDKALKVYEDAIRSGVQNSNIYTYYGMLLSDPGRHQEALAALDIAIQIDPENKLAFEVKGEVLLMLDRYGEALEAFDEAIRLGTRHSLIFVKKGEALIGLGRYQEALFASEQAIKSNPEGDYWRNSPAYLTKGYALYKLNMYKEALEAYDKGHKFGAAGSFRQVIVARRTSYTSGIMLISFGRYEEALRCCNWALSNGTTKQTFPKDSEIYRLKAEVLSRLGRGKEAQEALDGAIR